MQTRRVLMSRRFILIGILILAAFVVEACGHRQNPVGSLPPVELNEFPFTVGTRWLYAAEDTVRGLVDTIEVEIAGGTLWRFHSRHNQIGRADEDVTVLGDTVFFKDERDVNPYLRLIFPIVAGASWSHAQGIGDYVTDVEGEVRVTVPAGTFRAYQVNTNLKPRAQGLVLGWRHWLVPAVGFVKIDFFFGSTADIATYETWELLSYTQAS
jgi:hypothetical protein